MPSITAANAIVTLTIPGLFTGPQQLQGFAQDDIFDVPAIESVEVLMGVDGILSAGFVFKAIPWTFTLQGDSDSNLLFDQWWTQMQAVREDISATGQIVLAAIGTKWNLNNGHLTSYKPAPDAKRLLQPRKYTVTWGQIQPQPAS